MPGTGGGLPYWSPNGLYWADQPEPYGRTVPVGYARFARDRVDPGDYAVHFVGGWRVFLPRSMHPSERNRLASLIYAHGPARYGYVQIGDSLVPAKLSPGDRSALSGAAVMIAD